MNRLLLIILILSSVGVEAQDTIVKRNDEKIVSKIIEISTSQIIYKKFENIDGPNYTIDKLEVAEVNYENGLSEDFNEITIENSGSSKSIHETKAFIIKMIDEFGWEKGSDTRRLKAGFDGDYLHLWVMKKNYKKPVNDGWVYDFSAATSFHPISKRGGDIAYLNIWVPILSSEKKNTWKKRKLVIEMHNHDAAEQLRLALIHLKELTGQNKKKVEQF